VLGSLMLNGRGGGGKEIANTEWNTAELMGEKEEVKNHIRRTIMEAVLE